jgi:pimeloyl-ACP methyl ester carboxylesterase
MAGTGSRRSGQPALRLWPRLLRPLPREREAYVEAATSAFRLIGSPGFDRDEAELREMLELSYERGVNPDGTRRQLAAILAAGDRTDALARIEAPTVVIHGAADRLVAPSGGRATAAAIPGARLVLVDGMGHDLPREAWPAILDAVHGRTTA